MESLLAWGHYLAGITWIGILYYFNFIQVPFLKVGQARNQRPKRFSISSRTPCGGFDGEHCSNLGIRCELTPDASSTVLEVPLCSQGQDAIIGMGAWLGTIMLLNVWGIIWPNQKKVLGMKEATPEEKAKSARIALLASRTNTLLSIPMLFFMASSGHGPGYF